jgi:hypothetical protein
MFQYKKSLRLNEILLPGFFVLAFGVLFISVCGDGGIYEPPAGYIGGTVIDSLTSEPIQGALVGPDSLFAEPSVMATTDSLGRYVSLAGFPGIHRWAYCVCEGYRTQAKEHSVVSNETTIVDFKLLPQ